MKNFIIKIVLFIAILSLAIIFSCTIQKKEADPSLPPYTFTSVNFVPEAIDTRPVSNNNQRAIQILTLLKSLTFQPKLLSGTNIGNATFKLDKTYQMSVVDLKEETGKTPAILSVDYLWEEPIGNYTAVNKILTEHFKKGGLVTINMHPGNPFLGDLYKTGTGDYSFEDLFIPETKPYETWRSVLSHIGDGLEELEENDVVVLFRPLHEMNGNWFWWSFGESEQITNGEYTKLWISVYDYLINERGLKNLLWIYSPNSAHNKKDSRGVLELYPGDDYVDILGLDYYEDTLSEINRNKSIEALLSLGKPFGFAEFGPRTSEGFNNLTIPEELVEKIPQASFLIHWHTNVNESLPKPQSILDNSNPKGYMESDKIITRDDIKKHDISD